MAMLMIQQPIRIMENYQAPKTGQPIVNKYKKGGCDTRFRDYLTAIRAGDFDTCEALRNEHNEDIELMTKFRTIDQSFLRQMTMYLREIQITRRERDAWKSLADGRLKKIEGDHSGPNVWTLIQRGEAMLKQTAKARTEHELVEVPLGFQGTGK